MTMPRSEVMPPVERRRRWTRDEKERLVAACLEPGAIASEVARAAGVHASQLFRWRKALCERTSADAVHLVPVEVSAAPSPAQLPALASPRERDSGVIEIEVGDARIRVGADVDGAALGRVLKALSRR
jgi:transposase